MEIRIALAGNPNSGKTTMFNALTGASQYVGNWPGVTVEKKEGRLKGNRQAIIVDLPGIYSLSPYTLEEVVARDYLIGDRPDVLINIVDAGNLERNLYLTTQLLELGIPTVVALNQIDVVRKNGDKIDVKGLSSALGCPVIECSAVNGEGVKQVVAMALELNAKKAVPTFSDKFGGVVETALSAIEAAVGGAMPEGGTARFYAIKLFERDAKINYKPAANVRDKIEAATAACESELDDDAESIITNERYTLITSIIKKTYRKASKGLTISDKIDRVVTNRVLALPIFVVVIFLVYFISITTVGTFLTDWVNDVLFGEIIPPAVEGWLVGAGAADWLVSLVNDGIIAGVGAVLGFLPQMLVLFLCLALIEDCGYMARIAFILDRVFRKFGLSGKSFIPMLIGTGCSVPGIMASRTIENENDRRMTVITTSFMPCSAKLPIIALIAGALFGGAWWVAPSAYFVGIAAIICSGIILKKTRLFAGETSPFVMELPAYHLPRPKGVLLHVYDRGKSFVKKAGTIIFVSSILIWFLSSFSWSMEMVSDNPEASMLAAIGGVLAPLFAPMGFGNWQSAVAAITGLGAKEVVVSTFGILFGYAEVAEDGAEIWMNLRNFFTPLAGYSFLLFNLLNAPCFAAIGAMRREMNSGKWTWIAVGYQTALAYFVAMTVYQLGMLFTTGAFGVATAVSIVLLIGFIYLLVRPGGDRRTRELQKSAARA